MREGERVRYSPVSDNYRVVRRSGKKGGRVTIGAGNRDGGERVNVLKRVYGDQRSRGIPGNRLI